MVGLLDCLFVNRSSCYFCSGYSFRLVIRGKSGTKVLGDEKTDASRYTNYLRGATTPPEVMVEKGDNNRSRISSCKHMAYGLRDNVRIKLNSRRGVIRRRITVYSQSEEGRDVAAVEDQHGFRHLRGACACEECPRCDEYAKVTLALGPGKYPKILNSRIHSSTPNSIPCRVTRPF